MFVAARLSVWLRFRGGSLFSPRLFFVDAPVAGGRFATMLLTCQSGYESLLARELAELHGLEIGGKGPGWAIAAATGGRAGVPAAQLDSAFAHLTLVAPTEIRGDSVNGLAQQIADFFLGSLRGERVEVAWPSFWWGPAELVGLGRRISAVETAFGELLKKKLSRVAKLAVAGRPAARGGVRGLFVVFVDFGRVWVAREAVAGGQQRMADDDAAPSRSYLKVEESYGVLGRRPKEGERVCDLGAAPGGWSYSAAKHGAQVVAIDNGPLKGGALDHPRIEHLREDAFRFAPREGENFDWLFCDLVEEPHHVVENLVRPWIERGWCRSFVVNLKFGRVDPVKLLRELRAPDGVFGRWHSPVTIRHLYHDREEFTVVG